MTDTVRELLGRAYHDYEAAVKAARALWPGAAEGTLREAAADYLVHVRELRRQIGANGGQLSTISGVPAGAQPSHDPPPAAASPYAPTEKQITFYKRLVQSSVFSENERKRALEWLATKATRQTIKDQIDWLKRQVETRRNGAHPTH